MRVPKLKEEEYVPSTYSPRQIAKILGWKPRTKKFYERRLHALVLTLFDSGPRIDEVLSLRVQDCNLDDLLLTVTGKGRKQRVIPFSFELRRVLAKFILDFPTKPHEYLFNTKQGRKLSRRSVLRGVLAPGREPLPPSEDAWAYKPGNGAEVRKPRDGGLASGS